jgi:hypothetical protein
MLNKNILLIIGLIILISLGVILGLMFKNQPATPNPETGLEIKEAEVIVTTDIQQYYPGEVIKITITNNLDKSIFAHSSSLSIQYIQRKKTDGSWENLFAHCQFPHCIDRIGPPQEIKPHGSVIFKWEPLIYIEGTSETIEASPGIYRLEIGYQIREDSKPENWEWRTAYSNEFEIVDYAK